MTLGSWVRNQRVRRTNGSLRPELEAKLDSIGFLVRFVTAVFNPCGVIDAHFRCPHRSSGVSRQDHESYRIPCNSSIWTSAGTTCSISLSSTKIRTATARSLQLATTRVCRLENGSGMSGCGRYLLSSAHHLSHMIVSYLTPGPSERNTRRVL